MRPSPVSRLPAIVLATLLGLSFVESRAFCRDFYVSPNSGRDSNSGTTAAAPLASLKRLTAAKLTAGDRVFLAGGETIVGSLYFNAQDGATGPIEVTSYGSGRATLRTKKGSGIFVHDLGEARIHDLAVLGADKLSDTKLTSGTHGSGILFLNDLSHNERLQNVVISDVEVAGFVDVPSGRDGETVTHYGGSGIALFAEQGTAGYDHVTIQRAVAHHNARCGIGATAAYPQKGFRDFNVLDSKTYAQSGIPNLGTNTGSGILIAGIDGGLIDRCESYGNGFMNNHMGGPIGIWTYSSNAVIIRNSFSHDNTTLGSHDGGGFDLDGGATNCVLENNRSERNAGAGYLFAQWEGAPPFNHNIIRNNESVDDGQKNSSGGIAIWGDMYDCRIENNHVVKHRKPNTDPFGLGIVNYTGSNLVITGNTFQLDDGIPFILDFGPILDNSSLIFENNTYQNASHTFTAKFDDRVFRSLQELRASSAGTVEYETKSQPNAANPL